MSGVICEPGLQPVGSLERHRDEIQCLLQAIVRLGAAEAQEAGTRLAETLTAQAGNPEGVVCTFE